MMSNPKIMIAQPFFSAVSLSVKRIPRSYKNTCGNEEKSGVGETLGREGAWLGSQEGASKIKMSNGYV